MPVQDFPGPIIAQGLHPFDLGSRQPSEPRALGKELAQQAIRVLVCSPLPRTMGMRKIHPHLRLYREEAVLAHFRPLVVRERAAERGRQGPQFAREGLPHGGRILGFQRHQQGNPRRPLHQGTERRGIRMAHEQVPLPMPRHRAIRHLRWPLVDADQVLNRPRRQPHLAGPTKPMPTAEIADQFPLERASGPHIEIRVDGLMRDPHRRFVRIPLWQPARNLFGRPALREQREDRGAHAGLDPRASGACEDGGPSAALVGGQLPPDRSRARSHDEQAHGIAYSGLDSVPGRWLGGDDQQLTCD